MNRRSLLRLIGSAFAALGLKGKAKAIDAEPMPLALCLTTTRALSDAQRAHLQQYLHNAFKDHPALRRLPILILSPGMELKAVTPSDLTAADVAKLHESIEKNYRATVSLEEWLRGGREQL